MKTFYTIGFLLIGLVVNAQYLSGNEFQYTIAQDEIIEVYYKETNISEIDIRSQKIINDYYWFEDGIIYEIDKDYEEIIGSYNTNQITVYEQTYELQKPVFSKMILSKKNDSSFEVKIKSNTKQITIEDKKAQLPDVVKLWLVERGIERVEKRNNNAENIFEAFLQINTITFLLF